MRSAPVLSRSGLTGRSRLDTIQIPRQNPDTAARTIAESTYVLDPETSALHTFDEVGERIWELCDGERSVADIVTVIVSEYDVDASRAQADAIEFLDELVEKGLVSVS